MKQTSIPFYSRIWNKLKQFPETIAKGSSHPPPQSGVAAAAILSAGLSCLLMMINQHFTMISKQWNQIIWDLGAWMPGSHNQDPLYGSIGSYSGKVTFLIIVWLISWFLLHQLFKHKSIKAERVIFWLLISLAGAVIISWHPLIPYAPIS